MEKYLYKDLYRLEDKHWWHIAKRRNVLKILLKFNSFKNPKILDIGCGTGKNIEEFSKIGEVFGIDNDKQALYYCRKRGIKAVKFGSAEKTEFAKNSFDFVTLLDVLEHVDDKKALDEIHRILKPGGILILTAPALPKLWSRWDEVLHHKRRYTKGGMLLTLKQQKFKVLKLSYIYSFLIIPVFLIRLIKSKISKQNYSSDFKLSNSFINWILLYTSRLEAVIMDRWGIPIGTSLIAVARKIE